MKWILKLLALSFSLCLFSCEERTRRIVWSPSGSMATVIAGETLHLTDASGELTPPLVEGVRAAEWIDEDHLLVLRHLPIDWSEDAPPSASDGARDRIRSLTEEWVADRTPQESAVALKDSGGEGLYLFLCLYYDHRTYFEEVAEALEEPVDEETDEEARELNERLVAVAEVYQRSGEKLERSYALGEGLLVYSLFDRGNVDLRLSPSGDLALLTITKAGMDDGLWLLELKEGGELLSLVSGRIARYPDWSANGGEMYFMKAMHEDSDPDMGMLQRIALEDGDGEEVPGPPQAVAWTLFDEQARIRCVEDGRVFFTTSSFRFPLALEDPSHGEPLFAFDPEDRGSMDPVFSEEVLAELPGSLSAFELSPDETMMVVVRARQSEVFVVSLEGEATVTKVQTEQLGHLRWMPSWRSEDELCFVTVDETGERQVSLWNANDGSVRSLSESWPGEVREGLTEVPEVEK